MHETILQVERYHFGAISGGEGASGRCDSLARVESVREMIVGVLAEGDEGRNFGEAAVQLALDTVLTHLHHSQSADIPGQIAAAVAAANDAVMRENPTAQGDGLTTLAVTIIHEDRLYVRNSGASRIYLVSASGELVLLMQNPSGINISGGDSVLVCSHELIGEKLDRRAANREQKIVEITQTKSAPDVAARLVHFSDERRIGNHLSAVVIQNLTPHQLPAFAGAYVSASRNSRLRRGAFLAGLVILAVAWILAMSMMFSGQKERALPQNTQVVFNQVANIPQPEQTPTPSNDPGGNALNEGTGPFATVNGPSGTAQVILTSGSTVTTQDMAERIVIWGQNANPDYAYLLPNSQAQINFGSKTLVNLVKGSVYVQPGSGRLEVHLPQLQNSVARVQGSQMMVRALDNAQIEVLCFEGVCDFQTPGTINFILVAAGTRRTFDIANGITGTETPISLAEIADMNAMCNFCLASILPSASPDPSPTSTAMPTIIPNSMTVQVNPTQSQNAGQFGSASAPAQPQQPAIPPTLPPTSVPPTTVPTQNHPGPTPVAPTPGPGDVGGHGGHGGGGHGGGGGGGNGGGGGGGGNGKGGGGPNNPHPPLGAPFFKPHPPHPPHP
jgi:hypothetical protein